MPKSCRAFLLLTLLWAGCATAPPAPAPQWTQAPLAPKPPATAPAELAMGLEVHWVRNSAEYRAACAQTYALATSRIEQLAPELQAGTWAVALDGDETIWSNAEFQKSLLGGPYSVKAWKAWVARRAATALPGAIAFLTRVRELGGRIAIVTNRAEDECPATADNARQLELPFDLLWCKPEDTSEKEPRWDAIEAGTTPDGLPPLRIVLWLGDNIHDFPHLEQRMRFEPEAAYRDFGTRFFLIPNPMYGSFVGNARE
jgi:5'-nucleotidase (lipoprotein e(P4) family)